MRRRPVTSGTVSATDLEKGELRRAVRARLSALTPEEQVDTACELTASALKAPVAAGTPVGEIIYYVNSKELARTPLVAGTDIPDAAAPERGGWPWKNGFKS